ncbi:MAG: nicotinamidase [Gemmatimonadetes bacterium]|nr:nicotinamidase [Gemmatimonadota bacterium]
MFAALLLFSTSFTMAADKGSFDITKRSLMPTSDENVRFQPVYQKEAWNASETAVIVCDMWDLHHCLNATRRGAEVAPRMNQFLKTARKNGSLIIHAPSSCMKPYEDHPGRKRAQAAPMASNLPKQIAEWCYSIPEEEQGAYPIDQTDGGEDDDPAEHEAWAKELAAKGLNPRAPWTRQTDLLDIHKNDVISDSGVEIWNVMEAEGIKNVILVGVHTNMCVLGRPFGLRRLASNGKNVVLCRDLTDTMYNPKMKPYVSHFTGTDLIIEHIEKWVCPTMTSNQLLGDEPFQFKNDTRPHVVMLIAEREYVTNETLPKFALEHLGKEYKVTILHCDEEGQGKRDDIPGTAQALKDADVLLVSVRRRALQAKDFKAVEEHIKAGKPVVGIRTANHAFSLRGVEAPEGHMVWEGFDAEVWGGSYTGHHGAGKAVTIKKLADHPILEGVDVDSFDGTGSLYIVNPIADSTHAILTGTIDGEPTEPIAWTNKTKFGGKAFYTSLGHVGEFEQIQMNILLKNAIDWAVSE